jgi:hypothetical protein
LSANLLGKNITEDANRIWSAGCSELRIGLDPHLCISFNPDFDAFDYFFVHNGVAQLIDRIVSPSYSEDLAVM